MAGASITRDRVDQILEEIVVDAPKRKKKGSEITICYSVADGPKAHEIWFRSSSCPLDANSDSAIPIFLLAAMRRGIPLRVSGTLSPQLLGSISKIQNIFHSWSPDFTPIQVMASKWPQEQPVGRDRKIATFFSGGVDSLYTLIRNQKEITSLIYVHGFDVRHNDWKLREKIIKGIRQAADYFEKELFEIETNLRSFSDNYADWGSYYHGSGLASVALLLSSVFEKIYIPATYAYANLIPNGSHPDLDPLWSTESLRIVHEGAGATRFEKSKFLSQFEIIFRTLRVCWKNFDGLYNCGRCEKCLRTMIDFYTVGVLKKFAVFPHQLNLSQIRRIPLKDFHKRVFLQESLDACRAYRNDAELVEALNDCLDQTYFKGIRGWPKRSMNWLKRMWRKWFDIQAAKFGIW